MQGWDHENRSGSEGCDTPDRAGRGIFFEANGLTLRNGDADGKSTSRQTSHRATQPLNDGQRLIVGGEQIGRHREARQGAYDTGRAPCGRSAMGH